MNVIVLTFIRAIVNLIIIALLFLSYRDNIAMAWFGAAIVAIVKLSNCLDNISDRVESIAEAIKGN